MSTFQLSDEQKAILTHDAARHARVLAGPGTGKSATMVLLLERLLTQETPPKVRMLTFTRAATAELAQKLVEHGLSAVEKPSTVHSFAISVLMKNKGAGGFPEPLRIADEWEYKNIVAPTLARRAGVHPKQVKELFHELAANWERLSEEKSRKVRAEDRGKFLAVWQEHREVFGYTLLGELPYALLNALRDHEDLRGVDFDLLVVDEYQDLNACDLAMLLEIGKHGCKIVAAGDDDQSIYSFRRAAPEGIRRFKTDYPGSADYSLSVSRRCGQKIVEWGRWVIESDPDRPKDKLPLKAAEGSPPGEVALLSFKGEKSEAAGVAGIVKRLIEVEKLEPGQILILLRGDHNGQFSKPIREALADDGIETSDPDAVTKMLGEATNRRLLATLRLAVSKDDSLAWATLLELETGIGKTFIDATYEHARGKRITFAAALAAMSDSRFEGINKAVATRAAGLLSRVRAWLEAHRLPDGDDQKWGAWIASVAGGDVAPSPTEELRLLVEQLDAMVDQVGGLGGYLGQITPFGKDLAQSRSDRVRLMSMASSKGLTVRAAVVVGVEDTIVPMPDADVAEERRLLYVAMTRAKEFQFCTWAGSRTGPTARTGSARVREKRQQSRFLQGGPVNSQRGEDYIKARWPRK